MILGRLILRTDSAAYSIVRATWVTKIFVTGDILCFFIQSGGAGMLVQAKDSDGIKRGENIILGGLVLQILIFGFFVAVAATWHRRLMARPTAKSADLPWMRFVWLLYAASALITIRNFCRVVEYALGRVNSAITIFGKTAGADVELGRLSHYARMAAVRLRLPHDGNDPCCVCLLV